MKEPSQIQIDETLLRSLFRISTAEILGTSLTILTTYAFFGPSKETFILGSLNTALAVFKITGVYLNDRGWSVVKFGRNKQPQSARHLAKDSKLRSLLKVAIVPALSGSTVGSVITFIVTGAISDSVLISVINSFGVKLPVRYLNERLWTRTEWGMVGSTPVRSNATVIDYLNRMIGRIPQNTR